MQPDQSFFRRREALVSGALVLLCVVAFAPLKNCGFVSFDDNVTVTQNHYLQTGVNRYSTSWALVSTDGKDWYPLTRMSYLLDYELYGLKYPAGYHLTNFLLHVVNVLLLYWVFRRMTGAWGPSALVAALFAVHPLHVESVAWIADRKDVLSTLFWLLTMATYVLFVEKPGPWRYSAMVVAFGLGLTAKSMLISLPFVLLLLDYWPLGRLPAAGWGRRLVILTEKVPLLILAAASCVATYRIQAHSPDVGSLGTMSLSTRTAAAVLSYATYLVQMVWPVNLGAMYLYTNISWSDNRVLASCAFLVTVTLAAILFARRLPFLTVGWFWYLGTLVPVLGLVSFSRTAHADRYTYVPLIGIFVIFVWGLGALAARGVLVRRLVLTGTGLALGACVALTWVQLRYWRDDVAFYSRILEVASPNPYAHYGLGRAYMDNGQFENAVDQFSQAITLYPQFGDARLNLGYSYVLMGKIPEADAAYAPLLRDPSEDLQRHLFRAEPRNIIQSPHLRVMRYARVLRIQPRTAQADLGLAELMLGFSKVDASNHYLAEAEQADPVIAKTERFQEVAEAVKRRVANRQ